MEIRFSSAVAPATAADSASRTSWERSGSPSRDESAAWVSLSAHAQMLLQLQHIADSHPPSARGLLSDVAAKLRTDAGQPGKQFLGKLAEQVQRASESGDFSALAALGEVPVTEAPAGARAVGVAAYARTMEVARFSGASDAPASASPAAWGGSAGLNAPAPPRSLGVAAYARAMDSARAQAAQASAN